MLQKSVTINGKRYSTKKLFALVIKAINNNLNINGGDIILDLEDMIYYAQFRNKNDSYTENPVEAVYIRIFKPYTNKNYFVRI